MCICTNQSVSINSLVFMPYTQVTEHRHQKGKDRRMANRFSFCNGKYSHAAVNSVLNYGNQICLHMSNWPCSGMLIKLTYSSAVDKIQFAGLPVRTHTRKHTLFD